MDKQIFIVNDVLFSESDIELIKKANEIVFDYYKKWNYLNQSTFLGMHLPLSPDHRKNLDISFGLRAEILKSLEREYPSRIFNVTVTIYRTNPIDNYQYTYIVDYNIDWEEKASS